MKNKTKLITIIILIVLSIIFICASLIMLFTGKKQNNDSKDNKEIKKEIHYNGIFDKEGAIIATYLYNGRLIYSFNIGIYVDEGETDLKDNEATIKLAEGDISFKYNYDGIKVSSTIEDFKNGQYSYKEEYTLDNYYKDHYGDSKYLNDPISGIYKNESNKIQILKKSAYIIIVYIESNGSLDEYELALTSENEYHIAFSSLNITIKVDGKTIYVDMNTPNPDDSKYTGTYTKIKDLKLESMMESTLTGKIVE